MPHLVAVALVGVDDCSRVVHGHSCLTQWTWHFEVKLALVQCHGLGRRIFRRMAGVPAAVFVQTVLGRASDWAWARHWSPAEVRTAVTVAGLAGAGRSRRPVPAPRGRIR